MNNILFSAHIAHQTLFERVVLFLFAFVAALGVEGEAFSPDHERVVEGHFCSCAGDLLCIRSVLGACWRLFGEAKSRREASIGLLVARLGLQRQLLRVAKLWAVDHLECPRDEEIRLPSICLLGLRGLLSPRLRRLLDDVVEARVDVSLHCANTRGLY